jgi:hypothetical protein
MVKSYNSPIAGFIEDIIDCVLFYLYENSNIKLTLANPSPDISFLASDSRMHKPSNEEQTLSQYLQLPTLNTQKS